MKLAFALLLISSTAMFAQSAAPVAPALSGAWIITGDVEGNPVNETCTLVQAADKLTGSCVLEGKAYATTGTITGQKIVLIHGGEYDGTVLTLTYSGTLNDKGEISGSLAVDPMGVDGVFTAKKAVSA